MVLVVDEYAIGADVVVIIQVVVVVAVGTWVADDAVVVIIEVVVVVAVGTWWLAVVVGGWVSGGVAAEVVTKWQREWLRTGAMCHTV